MEDHIVDHSKLFTTPNTLTAVQRGIPEETLYLWPYLLPCGEVRPRVISCLLHLAMQQEEEGSGRCWVWTGVVVAWTARFPL